MDKRSLNSDWTCVPRKSIATQKNGHTNIHLSHIPGFNEMNSNLDKSQHLPLDGVVELGLRRLPFGLTEGQDRERWEVIRAAAGGPRTECGCLHTEARCTRSMLLYLKSSVPCGQRD